VAIASFPGWQHHGSQNGRLVRAWQGHFSVSNQGSAFIRVSQIPQRNRRGQIEVAHFVLAEWGAKRSQSQKESGFKFCSEGGEIFFGGGGGARQRALARAFAPLSLVYPPQSSFPYFTPLHFPATQSATLFSRSANTA
jgi:hypothetical protein